MNPILIPQVLGALWLLDDSKIVAKANFNLSLSQLESALYKSAFQKTASAYKAEVEKNKKEV